MAVTFEQFIRSLGIQESRGDYGVRNPRTGALGKYQVMPQNLDGSWNGKAKANSGWDYEALGRDVTKEEFLANPQLQEKIALHQLKRQFDAHGAEKAALWWYSGSTSPKNIDVRPAKNEPTPREYAASVVKRAGGQPSTPLQASTAVPTPQQTTSTQPQNPWANLLGSSIFSTPQTQAPNTQALPVVNLGGQLAIPENKTEQNAFADIIGAGVSPQQEPIYANAAAALAQARQMQNSVNLLPSNPLEVALSNLFDTIDTKEVGNG